MVDVRAFLTAHTTVQSRFSDGREWVVPCLCDRAKKSRQYHLWINVEKVQGICYRCGRTARGEVAIVQAVLGCRIDEAMAFVMENTTPTTRLDDAIRPLLAEPDGVDADEERVAVMRLPDEFIAARVVKPDELPSYAVKRGLSYKTCVRQSIGWCEEGYYANRLIVPVYSVTGALVSFVARWMGSKTPEGVKKVLYPKGSKTSHVLFNHARAARTDHIVVTEGVFDAMAVGKHGVALFGKHASVTQRELLCDLGLERRVTIMLDPDAEHDAHELADHLAMALDDVRVATCPRKDPAECTADEIASALVDAIRLGDRFEDLRATVSRL